MSNEKINYNFNDYGFAYEPTVTTPVTGLLDQLTIPFQSFSELIGQ